MLPLSRSRWRASGAVASHRRDADDVFPRQFVLLGAPLPLGVHCPVLVEAGPVAVEVVAPVEFGEPPAVQAAEVSRVSHLGRLVVAVEAPEPNLRGVDAGLVLQGLV